MKLGSNQIDAVVFDLFETLITESGVQKLSKADVAGRLGVGVEEFGREWRARQRDRFRGRFPDYASVLRAICTSLDVEACESVILEIQNERIRIMTTPYHRVEDEIVDTLRRIRTMQLRIGVISNCSREEVLPWPKSQLAPLFDAAMFSHEVQCMKPQREIYQLACKRLDVSSDRVLFVGDGGADELAGAARVGMTPLWATWFLRGWSHWSPGAHPQASTYPELKSPGDLLDYIENLRDT